MKAVEFHPGIQADRGNTLAAVLVGGQSRRMGVSKPALRLPSGRTLLDHAVVLAGEFARETVLVGRLPENVLTPNLDVWPDDLPGEGPLAAVATVLRRCSHAWALVLACDVPRLTAGALRALQAAADGSCPVIVARGQRDEQPNPLLAYYRRTLRDAMAAAVAAGERSLVRFLRDCDVRVVTLDSPETLASVNTPQDWAEFLAGSTPVSFD